MTCDLPFVPAVVSVLTGVSMRVRVSPQIVEFLSIRDSPQDFSHFGDDTRFKNLASTYLATQKIPCYLVGLYSSTCLTQKGFVLLTR